MQSSFNHSKMLVEVVLCQHTIYTSVFILHISGVARTSVRGDTFEGRPRRGSGADHTGGQRMFENMQEIS